MVSLPSLNEAQGRAVRHPPGPLLVLAGAGSGKTRVLTYRIAHLIQAHGISPPRVLAVTFTNKAAREMEERVAQALNLGPGRGFPLVVTFHSLGLRILRAHAKDVGLPKRFAIYDQSDAKALARRVLADTQVKVPDEMSPELLCYFAGKEKAERRDPSQSLQRADGFRGRKLAQLYKEYQEALMGAGAVDFQDLLFWPLKLIETKPKILEKMRDRFDAVLVDEYQDTNENQYLLVKKLAEIHRNLTVVGDDDQSIYGWRGADSRNLRRFLEDFPEAERVALEVNYRSTAKVLEAANAVLEVIPDRLEKTLIPAGEEGEPLRLYSALDASEEARWVVTDLEKRAREGRLPFTAFGILYRANKMAQAFEEELQRQEIPYRVVGGQKFFEKKEVKDALAFLKILAYPGDDLALRRVWNTPPRGLGPKAQASLIEAAKIQGTSVFQQLRRAEEVGLEGRSLSGAQTLLGSLTRARGALNQGRPFPQILRALLDEIGYSKELARLYRDAKTSEKKSQALESLIEGMQRSKARNPKLDLPTYLNQMSLLDEMDRTKDEDSGGLGQVTLQSIHSSKGLEYPHVYLVGMEEGHFPSERSLEDPERGLPEEMRLFYVAVTRAQKALAFTLCQLRDNGKGKIREVSPSRFLRLVPEHLVDIVHDAEPESIPGNRLEALRAMQRARKAESPWGKKPE